MVAAGVGLLLAGPAAAQRAAAPVDLLLHDAAIYTFHWPDPDREGRPAAGAPVRGGRWTPDANWIAITDGRITALGRGAPTAALRRDARTVRALAGATVLPGFVESHGHYTELGEAAAEADLNGVTTMDEMVARVRRHAETRPADEWLVGAGWDEGTWADHLPDHAALSAAFPDRPVVLKGRRGFGILGNAAALAAAGIGNTTPAPSGGEIVRRADGSPTGVLLNRAVPLLRDAIPARTLAQRTAIVRDGLAAILRAGYVTGHHAGVYGDYLAAYEALAARDALPVRMQLFLAARAGNDSVFAAWLPRGPTRDREAMLQVRGVKGYYDGSLGSRGALLLDDYADQPGTRGIGGRAYGFPDTLVLAAMRAGFQAAIHAIGDGGNRAVLDFYAAAFAATPALRAGRHRVEHAQVVAPADLPRFGALGLVASMEPPHAVEDAPWVPARLGPARVAGAYAWRSLRRGGALLVFNSDLLGSDFGIGYGLHSAITRTDRDGRPPGGWRPTERVTIEEAIRAYTVWPARASGLEDRTGILAPGRWADLTVLSADPLNAAPDALLALQPRMTVVAGRVAWEASAP